MRKKEIIWIGVLLVLCGVYVHYFSHWFDKPEIGISASIRPNRRSKTSDPIVVFSLNGDYSLTSVKVVPVEGTNFSPLAVPVWHLISDSNSIPLRGFRYGQPIKGMKPALKGVRPDPLVPGTIYRIILTAGDLTGHKDFKR